MARLVYRASDIRSDDYIMLQATYNMKSCPVCDYTVYEDAEHMIMSCTHNEELRRHMREDLANPRNLQKAMGRCDTTHNSTDI